MKNAVGDLPKPEAVWRALSKMAVAAAFYEKWHREIESAYRQRSSLKRIPQEVEGFLNDLKSLVNIASPKRRGPRKTERQNKAATFSELINIWILYNERVKAGDSKSMATKRVGERVKIDGKTVVRRLNDLDDRLRAKSAKSRTPDNQLNAELFFRANFRLKQMLANCLGGKIKSRKAIFPGKGLLVPPTDIEVDLF